MVIGWCEIDVWWGFSFAHVLARVVSGFGDLPFDVASAWLVLKFGILGLRFVGLRFGIWVDFGFGLCKVGFMGFVVLGVFLVLAGFGFWSFGFNAGFLVCFLD